MPTAAKFPRLVTAALLLVLAVFAVRYLAAIGSGVGHLTAIRTYVFWALVTIPVALLADVLARTVMNYRVVRLAVARVRSDSRRN